MTTRRDFVKLTALGGTALLFGIRLAPEGRADEAKPFRPNAWLRIDREGIVTVTVGKSEMGQGVRTSLPMIVADELGADWSRLVIEQASTGPEYPSLNTGGSGSIEGNWKRMRQAGAAAREMLLAAAAARWSVDQATLRAVNGMVFDDAHGRRAGFGTFVEAAAKLPVPANPPFKSASQYRIIGRPTSRIDDHKIATGTAKYGLDTRVAGMRFATIIRPPTAGGSVASLDATKAMQVAGIRDVVRIPSGVAIVGDNTWATIKARPLVDVTWTDGPHHDFDSRHFIESMIEQAKQTGVVMRAEGDVSAAMANAAMTIEATYVYPFYAHAAIEPMNCIADVRKDSCELWAPTQAPNRVQQSVAKQLGLPPERVSVHVTLMGGGFGRRLAADYAIEAAEVSRAIGAPVQVVWTREDDLRHGHIQHASVHAMRAGIDAEGKVVAWTHRKVSNPVMPVFDPPTADELKDRPAYYRDAAWGAYDVPYAIPNLETSYVQVESPVRYGPWRSVFAPSSVFARESFIDELAHAAHRDPLQLRLDLLQGADNVKAGELTINRPRLRRVLEAARTHSGWSTPLPAGRARGVACNVYDGDTHVAYVVEITMRPDGTFRVDRVVCAIDCGLVINPIGVEQQVEGGVIWALSQLSSEITMRNGAIEQSTYSDYPLPRIDEVPLVETHILGSDATQPFGMGEPPVPPLVPAVLNALFAASGRRVRRLPL